MCSRVLRVNQRRNAAHVAWSSPKTHGDQPTSFGAASRATASMASRTQSMLPSPPHWTSSTPPGRSARASRAQRRSWSVTQCSVAVETTASTGSARSRSSTSWQPHLHAIAEPPACEPHHFRRRVQRQHSASGNERQQRLRDPPGSAADIQRRRVRRDSLEACEHLARPRLLRLARLSYLRASQGGPHRNVRLRARRQVAAATRRSAAAGAHAGAVAAAHGIHRDLTSCGGVAEQMTRKPAD
jgi:hypothetical protein